MMPTAELLVVPVETTRSAACPKQLSTKRSRRKRKRNVKVWFVEKGPFGHFLQRVAEAGCCKSGAPRSTEGWARRGLTRVDAMEVMVGNTKSPKWG
jgi:hypothetical protein